MSEMGSRRGRRTNYLDRSWLGHWAGLALLPIHAPDVAELRSKLLDFMIANPDHPISCTVEEGGRRWRPVKPEDRQRHVEHVITGVGPFDREDPFGHIYALRPADDERAPVRFMVGPDWIVSFVAHVAGDALVQPQLTVSLALGDFDQVKLLRTDAGLIDTAKMLVKYFRPHWRDWLHHMRSGESAPPRLAAELPARLTESRTAAVSVTMSADEFASLKAWRRAHWPDTSLTALMVSATFRALAGQEVPMNSDGFYTLVDTRRYLPPEDSTRPGNLAKSVYIATDLNRPTEVLASMKQVLDSARAIPALFVGALSAALLGGRDEPAAESAGQPITLIFNSLQRLYGVDRIPWTNPAEAQFLQMSYPISPNQISVAACGHLGGMVFSASFDPGFVDGDAVRRALEELRDLPSLLKSVTPRPADLAGSRGV